MVGGGAQIDGERVRGLAWWPRAWLGSLGLDATRCAIIHVRGDSMEPTLPDGCSVLFDRNRWARRARGIYVVHTSDGLVVKRATRRGRGWDLTSGNPVFAPETRTADTETIGEVVWAARTLIEPRRG